MTHGGVVALLVAMRRPDLAKVTAEHAHEPSLTPADLRTISTRTLVLVADAEARLEHAIEMYRCVPDAELAVVPGTSHGLLVEKSDLCNQIIVRFLAGDPVPTLAPMRRRGSPAGRA